MNGGGIMEKICQESACTGCCACADKCPQNAIAIEVNSEGFLSPRIDQLVCNECGLCKTVCTGLLDYRLDDSVAFSAYRCWSNNDEDRVTSSSGGMFSVLAKWALQNEGVVIGAAFDEKLELRHFEATAVDDLKGLRGSKYIASNMSGMYNKIKLLLEEGRTVLFTGTPCQTQGLLLFLYKKYSNLITCDFICHGVGSTELFNDYLKGLSKEYDAIPESVQFRKKKYDYIRFVFEVTFDNGDVFEDFFCSTFFGYYFMKSTCNRKACSNCNFATLNRVSDFTLADYGCNDKYKFPQNELKKGISLVLVNTEKAKSLFDTLSDQVNRSKCSIDDILESSNAPRLTGKCFSSKDRNEFFADYQKLSYDVFYKKWNSEIPKDFRKQILYSGKITGNPVQIAYRIKNRIQSKIKLK